MQVMISRVKINYQKKPYTEMLFNIYCIPIIESKDIF